MVLSEGEAIAPFFRVPRRSGWKSGYTQGQPLNRVIDISLPIKPGMLLYPGDPPPVLRRLLSLEDGDSLTASELSIGCHAGTHVDAPAHFCLGGVTLDQLALQHFAGPAIVLDFTGRSRIEASGVRHAAIPANHHVLLKTDNCGYLRQSEFKSDYCWLTPDAARHLLTCDPLSIGFDYYSLDPPSDSAFPAHVAIAGRGIPVYVCLDLSVVSAGRYQFFAAPLAVAGAEGMPVRALLMPSATQ